MKRIIGVLVAVVCCALLLSVGVGAESFTLSGTDISVDMDTTSWYVFTRDNIKDNAELDEFGITYDEIYNILYENKAYMDAVLCFDDGSYVEMFIRKTELDSEVVNLSNYSDSDVREFAQVIAESQETEDYSVYKTDYKFAKLVYSDAPSGLNLVEFYTIVNKDSYVVTFQASAEYGDYENAEIEKIMKSIKFEVDESLKEPKSNDSAGESALEGAAIGAIVGGVSGLIGALVNKRRKKKAAQQAQPEIQE